MQQQHEMKASQGAAITQRLQEAGILQHKCLGTGVLKDESQLLDRCSAAAYSGSSTEAHQALINCQPARAVLGKQGDHIT